MSPSSSTPQRPGLLGWLQRSWACRSHSASGAAADTGGPQQHPAAAAAATTSSSSSRQGGPSHLVVMVNGLFGSAANWDVIAEQLAQHLPPDTLLHPSRVNARFSTYQGIDTCGQRLADEIRAVVAATPSLTRISVVAHSMGGLMARYAVGALFNPQRSLICGLQPCHFVSMATPHCGCDADGVAQVPFIGWTGDIPLLGQQLYRFLQSISGSTASLIFQRTGQQFFLLDGAFSPTAAAAAGRAAPAAAAAAAGQSDRAAVAKAAAAAAADRDKASAPPSAATAAAGAGNSSSSSGGGTQQLPLLLQMTQDCEDRGLYFYSALASFRTRTAYANMDGDHLVGFANSSLRSFEQLPPPPPKAAKAKGVVLQDSLSAAFWPHAWQQQQQQWSSSSSSGGTPGAAEVQGAISTPYTASRDWSQAQQQQQQVNGASASSSGSASSSWHVLNSAGTFGLGETGSASSSPQQQQQLLQPDPPHPASALAALELEAGGATPAATAAVAAAAAAASGVSSQQPSATTSAAGPAAADGSSGSRSKLLPLRYSRFRGQPGRGGAPLRTTVESAVAAAATGVATADAGVAAAAAAGEQAAGTPAVMDSTEEMIELQYSNPVTPAVQQQQQAQQQLESSVSSIDYEPRYQQQQQPSPAAVAAGGAAAVASAEADLTSGLSGQGSRPVAVAGSPAEAAADVAADAAVLTPAAGRAEAVAHMLRRLQEMPWRRIDVSFQGAKFGFAHNNIQVTRRWWNFEGVAVPAHLAQQLQLMDALLLGPQQQDQQQPQQQQ